MAELLRRYGKTIPYQSYYWLCSWSCIQAENNEKIDDEERIRKHKYAIALANDYIDFKVLSIERILKLSSLELLPAESLLKKLQELLPARETKMKESLTIELSFERDEIQLFEFKDRLW